MRFPTVPRLLAALLATTATAAHSNEPFPSFLERFCQSAAAEHTGATHFHLDRIAFPLKIKSSNTEQQEPKTSYLTSRKEYDPTTRTIHLPLCSGDGGLKDRRIVRTAQTATVHFKFGAGPQSILEFARKGSRWFLIAIEVQET
jgi:hypothetical protein